MSHSTGFRKSLIAFVATAVVMSISTLAESQTRKQPAGGAVAEKAVVAAIDDAIATLREPDYRQFLEHYAPVQLLQVIRREKAGVNGFADRMTRDKRTAGRIKELVARLQFARKTKPVFNQEKTIARFDFILEPARTLKPHELPFGKLAKKRIVLKGYGGDLPAALDKARAALDGGDFEDFLSHMLPETDLRLDDVAKLAKRLKSSPAVVKQMIADFKLLESQTPKLEQKGTVAVYRVKPKDSDEPGLRKGVKLPDRVFKFQKVAGNWRLYDNTKGLQAAAVKFGKIPAVQGTLVMEKFRDHWRTSHAGEDEPSYWREFYEEFGRPARNPFKESER